MSYGLPFHENDVVVTRGNHLSVVEDEVVKEMERIKDKTVTKLVISIPYRALSASHHIAGNYIHVKLQGGITGSLDDSKVRFTRSAHEAREDPAPADAALEPADAGAASVAVTVGLRPTAPTVMNPNDPATWGHVYRNAPCACGSGKRFKHCHGQLS